MKAKPKVNVEYGADGYGSYLVTITRGPVTVIRRFKGAEYIEAKAALSMTLQLLDDVEAGVVEVSA
jgi:hypothetical protein